MARRVYYSFHYQRDAFRVQKIFQMRNVEGQRLLSSQAWEDVAGGGAAAIERWINEQMAGKSCNVVLIGSETADRPWVRYEIKKAWNDGRGVLGIYIHRLTDGTGSTAAKGHNPFTHFSVDTHGGKVSMATVVPVLDPGGATSNDVYNVIRNNIESKVEEAIRVRGSLPK